VGVHPLGKMLAMTGAGVGADGRTLAALNGREARGVARGQLLLRLRLALLGLRLILARLVWLRLVWLRPRLWLIIRLLSGMLLLLLLALLLLALGDGRVAARIHIGLPLRPIVLRMRRCGQASSEEQSGGEQKPNWIRKAHGGGSSPSPSNRPEL
jgi:hypothetical protein